MDGVMGEIRMFAGDFAPRNWEFCDGQVYSILNNEALFSLLGTTYGGNGSTTFGLPDFRGHMPVGVGNGVSASVELGEVLPVGYTFTGRTDVNGLGMHFIICVYGVFPVLGP